MNDIIKKIRQQGLRFTSQRQYILKALSHHPQTVDELLLSLSKQQTKVDRVTVYRTLGCLQAMGVVIKTSFCKGVACYELKSNTHHHHLICDKCGVIEDVILDENELTKKAQEQTQFIIKSHELEFFGLCAKCQ